MASACNATSGPIADTICVGAWMVQFPGNESGTVFILSPGDTYSVNESDSLGYTKSVGEGCSGTIAAGQACAFTVQNQTASNYD